MPRKLARRGGGEVGANAQRKERERKSARAGRDFRDSAVPWLPEKRRRARAEEATSPLGHASDCRQKAAARPVGRRGLRARVLLGLADAPGWAVHSDLRVYPGADGAPRVGGCCRWLEGIPRSDDAPAAGGRYRG